MKRNKIIIDHFYCFLRSLLLAVGLVIATSAPLMAQRENTWAFNIGDGLDFNNLNRYGYPAYTPTGFAKYGWLPITATPFPPRATASICDAKGDLMFYTEGSNVWDVNNISMPNGRDITGLEAFSNIGPLAITEGATVIVPMIDSFNKYFIFSISSRMLPGVNDPGKLFYSVVNMDMNGGTGDVEPLRRGVLIDSQIATKIVAVPGDHCNIWLLVCDQNETLFKAYEITGAGINPAPVISNVGFTGMQSSFYPTIYGHIKASPNRKKLVRTQMSTYLLGFRQYCVGGLDLFDFDPATGVVSNQLILDGNYTTPLTHIRAYTSAEFSPDNSKVYGTLWDDVAMQSSHISFPHLVSQFDLNNPNPPATKTIVDSCSARDIKRGPDGKLYYGFETNASGGVSLNTLSAITQPNLLGAACAPRRSVVFGSAGLITSFFPNAVPIVRRDTILRKKDVYFCTSDRVLISATDTTGKQYQWNRIDSVDEELNGKTRRVSPGRYAVTYISTVSCSYYIDSFIVYPPGTVDLGPDIVTCTDPYPYTLNIAGQGSNISYRWQDGRTDSAYTINSNGIYWVEVEKTGCKTSDTIAVNYIDLTQPFSSDTDVCNLAKDQLLLQANVPSGSIALWNDGSSRSALLATENGTYWVQVSNGACVEKDTVNVRFIHLQTSLGDDKILCYGDPAITLSTLVPQQGAIEWSNGGIDTFITVHEPGTYSITLRERTCTSKDTIEVIEQYCNCIANIPNAFTPNGDGLNDVFRPVISKSCPLQTFLLQVFSRWGELLFETETAGIGWDGTYKGQPMDVGTYFFRLSYILPDTGARQFSKGDLTLIR